MIDFQITKRKTSLPLRSLNQSFRASNKIFVKQNILNEQLMIRNNDVNDSIKKRLVNQQNYSTARNFHSAKGKQSINLRRTSQSFNKKKLQSNLIQQIDYEDQMFRKTTLSMKSIMKKNKFFDELVDDIDFELRYKIIGQIGKGSFSTVSSALDKISHKNVAVKIYDKINTLGWYRLENIKKQINALKKVKHQNVVSLYHVVKDKNKLMLFMENCGRQTLSGLLRKSKVFDQKLTKKYFYQIIQALKHLHSLGISHRDLKPENILIDQKSNIKIIDFGFSAIGKNYLTSYCGTPPFMCPEIVLKKPYSGIKADIWAVGVILFLMLNGKLPFRAITQQELYRLIQTGKYSFSDQSISQNAKRLVNRILKVNPDERLTAQQIANDKWLKI